MSLLLRRRSIARAVAGELAPRAESRLRAHLRGCAACRRHYDALTLVRAAAGADLRGAASERQRLLSALGVRPAAVPPPRRRWAIPLVLAPVAIAAAAAVVIVARPAPEPEIAWRGTGAGPDDPAARAPLSLRFYARRKADGAPAGPVRLIGELPGSGELRASRRDELKISYVGPGEPRYLVLLAIDGRGQITRYYQGTAPLEPTRAPRLLGASIDLSRHEVAGPVRLYGVVSSTPPDLRRAEAELRARLSAPRPEFPPPGFGGVLWIDP